MQVIEDLKTDLTNLLTSKFDEIRAEIEKQGNTPPPIIKLNTSQISHEIKGHLDNLSIKVDEEKLISTLKSEFSKHELALRASQSRLESVQDMAISAIKATRAEKTEFVRVKFQGDFYGFTSWRPFALYFTLLSLAFTLTAYSWFHNTDDERLKSAIGYIHQLENGIERLRANNPKTAQKYFPHL
jgi:hypothetical protein